MVLGFKEVSRTYRTRGGAIRALDGVSLDVAVGELLVIRGPSGSGKTTLLLAGGGMLRPSSGTVLLNGSDLYAMGAGERAAFRAGEVGFVFQMYYLVPYLTILENVLLAGGAGPDAAKRDEARALLDRFGLTDRLAHKPSELSAGERQRTAVARALLNRPKLVLADEPTGNLDPENADFVLEHLADYAGQGGTVVVVTHGTAADRYAGRIVRLDQGRLDVRE